MIDVHHDDEGIIRFVTVQSDCRSVAGMVEVGKQSHSAKNSRKSQQPGTHVALWSSHSLSVSFVCGVIIRKHSMRRVSGNLLWLPGDVLGAAVRDAELLIDELGPLRGALEDIARLETIRSAGRELAATDECSDVAISARIATALIGICVKNKELIEKRIREIASHGIDVSAQAKLSSRVGAQAFDKDAFAARYPDLYRNCFRLRIPAPRLNILGSQLCPRDVLACDTDLSHLVREIPLILREGHEEGILGVLHDVWLRLDSVQATHEWRRALDRAWLKAACGTAPGIAGVARWVRSHRGNLEFDHNVLKENDPDLHQQFVSRRERISKFEMRRDRGQLAMLQPA